MKTIKDMISCAESAGYKVIKNGVENYSLRENGVVIDFTKPLKIHREVPPLASHHIYRDIPITMITSMIPQGFNVELWCFLMNKKDNDLIRFNEIKNLNIRGCSSDKDIIHSFDWMTHLGFVEEQDEYIHIYTYPTQGYRMPLCFLLEETERYAPYKFNN